MTITLNGDPFDTDAPTISALLERLDIDPRRVAVERNFVVVKRDAYGTTAVETGDQIEIVNFVGGGAETFGNVEIGKCGNLGPVE
jgi:thiamine biosynthesis protein ThiS